MAIVILLATPLLATMLSLAVRKRFLLLEMIAAVAAPVELAAVLVIILAVSRNGGYQTGRYLAVDPLGSIVLLTLGLVGTAATYYSIGYLRAEVGKGIIGFSRVRQYFILFHLFGGRVLRFSDLERAIPGISQKMLIQQLRQMEKDGIVRRIVHHQVPPKVEYCLTDWGQALCPALDALLTWAAQRESAED